MSFHLDRQITPQTKNVFVTVALFVMLPLLVIGAMQTYRIVTRAVGFPANITVDAGKELSPISTDFYHAFAQGGEEQTDMLAPVLAETKALSPKLIRLDHIYDSYQVVSGSGTGLSYDFSRLDAAISTILATGAKPILALSYMPPSISQDGSLIAPPRDWNDWAAVVRRTIEHYSGKSEKNISNIYYEVWNEPDLAQFGSWKLSGEKNYLTLYRYAAQGAQSAQNCNKFFFGGPVTTGLYKNWIIALASSGMRVDFFSWHSYLPEPNRFSQDQKNIVSWLLPYENHFGKPLIISEFGFTGAKDVRYGTLYSAAHTAATISNLMTAGPTYLFSFQIKDGPNQTDGSGWGLMKHESAGKTKKPRYGIYAFMDQMKGNLLPLSGEGTWVGGFATKNGQTIKILLVNFDPYNGRREEFVPVAINNLSPGTYTVTVRRYGIGSEAPSTITVSQKEPVKRTLRLATNGIAIIELTKTQ